MSRRDKIFVQLKKSDMVCKLVNNHNLMIAQHTHKQLWIMLWSLKLCIALVGKQNVVIALNYLERICRNSVHVHYFEKTWWDQKNSCNKCESSCKVCDRSKKFWLQKLMQQCESSCNVCDRSQKILIAKCYKVLVHQLWMSWRNVALQRIKWGGEVMDFKLTFTLRLCAGFSVLLCKILPLSLILFKTHRKLFDALNFIWTKVNHICIIHNLEIHIIL